MTCDFRCLLFSYYADLLQNTDTAVVNWSWEGKDHGLGPIKCFVKVSSVWAKTTTSLRLGGIIWHTTIMIRWLRLENNCLPQTKCILCPTFCWPINPFWSPPDADSVSRHFTWLPPLLTMEQRRRVPIILLYQFGTFADMKTDPVVPLGMTCHRRGPLKS